MSAWVALLRGVNVGTTNRLPMAELRASVEALGYDSVRTYIQSGNVVFAGDDDETTITRRLRQALVRRHGMDVPVVVRHSDELVGLAGRHPFADGELEPKHLHVAFLDRPPDLSAGPAPDDWVPDRWAVVGRELFLAYPRGSARSKMTIERFERPWGVTATARNVNTVMKLAELCAEVGASSSGGS